MVKSACRDGGGLFPFACAMPSFPAFFCGKIWLMYSQVHEVIFPLLIDGLLILLSTVIPLALKWGRDWLSAKIQNERVQLGIDTIDRVVHAVVASREQTLKRAYKEAKADGKVTREELEKMALDLKDGAIEDAKRTLGEEIPELVKDIASSFDVEEYISSRIEAEVFNFKQSS
jgi:hypothetical protein